jgi:hypothetical protein
MIHALFERKIQMCSCGKRVQVTLFDDIKPTAWGYPMWRVLHSLTELSGAQINKFLDQDEYYAWKSVLNILHTCLPCALCREHYSGWVQENPYEPIISLSGSERKNALRKWLFDLHNFTPMTGTCPRPTIEQLPDLYSTANIDIDAEIKEIVRILQLSSQGGIIPRDAYDAFRRYITNLYTIVRG